MTADRPYTDDDLAVAAEALRVAVVDLDWAGGITNTARVVLDAVDWDAIDKRAEERARESIVAWLRSGPSIPIDDPTDGGPVVGYLDPIVCHHAADAIEAQAGRRRAR